MSGFARPRYLCFETSFVATSEHIANKENLQHLPPDLGIPRSHCETSRNSPTSGWCRTRFGCRRPYGGHIEGIPARPNGARREPNRLSGLSPWGTSTGVSV